MKLNTFIAGTFGIIGFALSILAGLVAGNTFESILFRGVVLAGCCYLIGYGVGAMAQQVSTEHAARIAKRVADADAAEEQKDAEESAAREAEAAAQASGDVIVAPVSVSGPSR